MDLVTSLKSRLGPDTVARLSFWPDQEEGRSDGARVHVAASTVLIGPWDPDGPPQACGECVRTRWLRVRSHSERTLRTASQTDRVAASAPWPPDVPFVVDSTAILLSRVNDPEFGDTIPAVPPGCAFVTSLDLVSLQTETMLIERDPLCPGCSTWVGDEPSSQELIERTSIGSRCFSIDEYDLLDGALVNPVAGVLGNAAVEDVWSTTTAPVCGRVDSRSSTDCAELTWSGQTPTYNRSRLVGLLEGLERYAGSLRRRAIHPVMATTNDPLRRVDPRVMGLYDPRTYRDDPNLVPFDPDREIPWVWGYSVRDRQPILVAQRNVYYAGLLGADRFVDECSNGCASGSCYEEAVLHGLLEVIERDAFLMAWYGGAQLPVLGGGAELGANAAKLLNRASLLGYRVDLLDTSTDTAVPVVTALATRMDGGDGYLVLASGAALDPIEAAESALHEVLTYLPGRAKQAARRRPELLAMSTDPALVRSLRDHAELYGLPSQGKLAATLASPSREVTVQAMAARVGGGWSGNITADLIRIVDHLADLGYDVVVVDQTSPEQERRGISAVRVMVPGLLPMDFGWSRQRALLMPRLLNGPGAVRILPHPFP